MSVAIVTGASGLIGGEATRFLHEKGLRVAGVDNDMRRYFFGDDASTSGNSRHLLASLPNFELVTADIRDEAAMDALFARYGRDISVVVHAAGQPSHDWAAREPLTDFSVNATGTLIILEALRRHAPDATFIFTSTNKVYGDTPNRLPLVEQETRWELDPSHPYAVHGFDESMSIDHCLHSVFGVSKVAADVLVQEYGRYFGLNTGVFRCGCLTGPAHAAAELHGFLAYLVRCVVEGRPYTINGYKGKQVRDNIHAADLIGAFWAFHQSPRPGAVYNMGGSRFANCSMLEAIAIAREITGREFAPTLTDTPRIGDHIWWVSDVRRFQADYPEWRYQHDLRSTIGEIAAAVAERLDVKLA